VNRLAGHNYCPALFYLPYEPDETFDVLVRISPRW
jgi:hypothetical protein